VGLGYVSATNHQIAKKVEKEIRINLETNFILIKLSTDFLLTTLEDLDV
jgi:hypothetical protein